MKRPFHIRSDGAVAAVAFVALITSIGNAMAQAPGVKGFDDFHFVKARNIFDPNRRATRGEGSRDSRAMVEIVRANTLSLTGTMVADGRTLAFFSGSRSENSKVIGVGDTVADYKVKAIAPTQVELEKDGKTTPLGVGKMLTLEGAADVATGGAAPETPPPDPSAAAAPATGTAPTSTSSNDKNDVLRRMMERRAKEMNK